MDLYRSLFRGNGYLVPHRVRVCQGNNSACQNCCGSSLAGCKAHIMNSVVLNNSPNSSRLDHTPTPPTTALHICSAAPIGHRISIVSSPSLLTLIIGTILRWISPWIVALIIVIPVSSKRVLCFWPTEHGSRRTVPLGMCRPLDGHFWIDLAFHVFFIFRAVILLIGLTKLAACI